MTARNATTTATTRIASSIHAGTRPPLGRVGHAGRARERHADREFTAPDHRRQGIGRMLLDHFMDHARNIGASRVHLEVREGNPAVIMYRQAGFNFAGRRPKYYRGRFGGDFDALTLSRPL